MDSSLTDYIDPAKKNTGVGLVAVGAVGISISLLAVISIPLKGILSGTALSFISAIGILATPVAPVFIGILAGCALIAIIGVLLLRSKKPVVYLNKTLSPRIKDTLEDIENSLNVNPSNSLLEEWLVKGPVNPKINQMLGFYDKLYNDLGNIPENPWEDEETVNLFDQFIKAGFYVGISALEDLAPFAKKYADEEGEALTYAQLSSNEDFYFYRAVYWCSDAYRKARFAGSEEDQRQFYIEGTPQNEWRQLYNIHCEVFKQYLVPMDLEIPQHYPARMSRLFGDPSAAFEREYRITKGYEVCHLLWNLPDIAQEDGRQETKFLKNPYTRRA